ncbi:MULTISPECIES: hypothetical protein [unclassified Sphingopyxis]|uniref:hypothetical protein n=1 Tax=unclassified Sphingopyxis TaxID=2614943 RepID=UPI00072FA888|nr:MULTISPECIES: hypothetical protein [unclassified Sphingopyxis]KTE24479.1 hypothetical protein ATE61_13815 [Sphingopyxis sp. H057]KTE51007.1 hypothetical protein ATE69_17515 [Sphingopyxis sp. H071]KTE52150.1 hypothetical protein ATE64_12120 [Sphingopyxis sp. H073]KTE60517.1 hypothetical protein ATE66_08025 [Sphingopyxis sp. H107]KTE63894.1 hypothetical protein ATE65_13910 [Sphingopyxis sp. H100]
MSFLLDMVKVNVTSTGTGTLTLGTAIASFLTIAGSGGVDGREYSYVIEEGSAREVGWGVAGSSGTTLTRNCLRSTNSNSPISLSGSAIMYISPNTRDFDQLPGLKTAYRSGMMYGPSGWVQTNDADAPVADRMQLVPWPILRRVSIKSLHFYMATGATTGHKTRILIYRMGPNGHPLGAPVYDSGALTTETASTDIDITGLSLILEAGMYLACFWANNGTYRFGRCNGTTNAVMMAIAAGALLRGGGFGAGMVANATFTGSAPTFTDTASEMYSPIGGEPSYLGADAPCLTFKVT